MTTVVVDRNPTPRVLHLSQTRRRWQQGECVEFKTSEITRFEGQDRDAALFLDYVLLDVSQNRRKDEPYCCSRLLLPSLYLT